MARTCTICGDPRRDSLDSSIVSGASFRAISRQYGVSPDSLRRHAHGHLSPALAALQAEREAKRGGRLLDRVERLVTEAEAILASAKSEGKASLALAAVRELRESLRLLGAASGELRETPTVAVNLLSSGEWIRTRAVIVQALASYPQARAAVAAALVALQQGDGKESRSGLLLTGEGRFNAAEKPS